MKKTITAIAILAASASAVHAQLQMNHLDLSVTAGTTGIGFDFAMPVNDLLQVRMGASFLPNSQKKMQMSARLTSPAIIIEDGTPYINNKTPEENQQLSNLYYPKLAGVLSGVAGENITKDINLIGEPSFNNFKFLVDIFPFKDNRHWHVTAGFYLGSSTVANVSNISTDMTSLMAVSMYNQMYHNALGEEPLFTYYPNNDPNSGLSVYMPDKFNEDIMTYGDISFPIAKYSHDIYAQEDILWEYTQIDPILGDVIEDPITGTMIEKGQVRYHKGDLIHAKGDEYRMLPDADNMIKARVRTNSFRPYLGCGYASSITKDKRTSISVDAGVLFWGGTPEIIMHDGTNVLRDLQNVDGKFGDYARSVSHMKVYPSINIRLTRRLF